MPLRRWSGASTRLPQFPAVPLAFLFFIHTHSSAGCVVPNLYVSPVPYGSKETLPKRELGLPSRRTREQASLLRPMATVYLYQEDEKVMNKEDVRETSMKLPTVKYPSGLEVSLAAFLLKMASLDVGQAQRCSINRESLVLRTSNSRHFIIKRRET